MILAGFSVDDNHKDWVMWEVIKYNKARQLIECKFKGISYANSTLINSLITLAEPQSGIVRDIDYKKLRNLLTVTSASGRKDSGTPSKQTIRNWIKSIERECGDYFRVISEGQKLQFFFPEMPKIFNEIFGTTQVNTEDEPSEPIENIDEKAVLEQEVNIQLNTEVNTPKPPVKNNIININNNKQTNTKEAVSSVKKFISDDFYPDEQTIELANTLGYSSAKSPEEIKAFIHHNKINQTQWADFNPIYIRWLERKAEYQAKQQNRIKGLLRSHNNERRFYQKSSQQAELHAVSLTHGIACDSIWECDDSCNEMPAVSGRLIEIMDETHSNLWSDFR